MNALGRLGLAVLLAGGITAGWITWARAPASTGQTPVVDGNEAPAGPVFFSEADVAAVSGDPDTVVEAMYRARGNDLMRLTGPAFEGLPEDLRKLAFVTVLAHDMKPYGASTALEFGALLVAGALDCDNYAALAWHLLQRLKPGSELRVAFVGWEGGAIGNHAQLFGATGTGELLADPTLALIAVTGFDSIASGVPVPDSQVWSAPRYAPVLWLHGKVRKALRDGGYRPSDLLYYFDSLQDYRDAGASSARWATPAIARRRAASPPSR